MSGTRRTPGSVSGTDTWLITTEPLDPWTLLPWQRWRWCAYVPGRQSYIGSRMSSGMGYALTPGGALRGARRFIAGEQKRAARWGRRLARSARESV